MEPRKRAARILPDSRLFAYVVVASVIAIFLASAAVSFQGQAALAETYMHLTGPTRFLVPVIIDASLLVYAASALVRRARGESVRLAVAASAFWMAVSITANVVHALQPASVIVGAALAALAPIAILMSSVTIESLLVAPPAVGEMLDREAALTAELAASQEAVEKSVVEADQLKARIARLEAAAKLTASATTPAAVVQGTPKQKALSAVPDAQPITDRAALASQAVTLREEGLTLPATAQALGISLSSVKRLISTTATTSAA
ncbi:hypothetical protein B5P43_15555 [Bacillus sp. SRB_336]|nr:hypothetical protein B5P43_15555 [Bacillus sp. SRB_336]